VQRQADLRRRRPGAHERHARLQRGGLRVPGDDQRDLRAPRARHQAVQRGLAPSGCTSTSARSWPASLRNLVDLAVGDFIGCGKYIWQNHGVNGDCAWAAANFIPYEKLFAWAKAVVGLKMAARSGEGPGRGVRRPPAGPTVDLNTAIKLETEINEDITRACLTQSFDAPRRC
jgi:hypothetical protein